MFFISSYRSETLRKPPRLALATLSELPNGWLLCHRWASCEISFGSYSNHTIILDRRHLFDWLVCKQSEC